MIDIVARNALVEQFRPLVHQIAGKLYHRRPSIRQLGTVDDVAQIGFLGLIRAAELFNPDNPSRTKFMSYAYAAIANTIYRYAEEAGLIRIPNWAVKAMRDEQRGIVPRGKKATLALARAAWHVQRLGRTWDKHAEEDEEEADSDLGRLRQVLPLLDDRPRYLVERYYGLDGARPQNLRQLAEEAGVTHERIRQVLQKALKELRRLLDPEDSHGRDNVDRQRPVSRRKFPARIRAAS